MSERIWTIVLQSSLVLSAAGLMSLALRRNSAALRHYVWTLALVFAAVVPFVPERTVGRTIELTMVAPTRIVVRGNEAAAAPVDWLAAIWVAGVVVLLVREAAAQLKALWLRRRALRGMGDHDFSPDLAVPVVSGLLRPRILLPVDAQCWPVERLEAVLAHERMHVVRRDLVWQFIGRIAAAMYWPNPLVWLALSQQHRECEQACDDGVVEAGLPAADYAGHLVAIARNLQSQPLLEGGLSMAKVSTLEQRLSALLNPLTSHRPVSRGTLVLTFALSVALLAPVAGLKLIAQTSESGLRGVVKDASGASVPDAKVSLRFTKQSDGGRVELTRTNAAGEFSFPNVPEDYYAIVIEKEGFAALSNTSVKLGGSFNPRLVFTLNLGGMKESIRVSAGGAPPPPPPPPTGGVAGGVPGGVAGGVTGGVAMRIRVGGNVQAAKLLNKVNPIYPADCKAEGVSGIVLLTAVIGKDGAVLSLEPVNQFVDDRLKESAMSAVKLWRYQPTLLNGNPIEVVTQVEVNFTLAP